MRIARTSMVRIMARSGTRFARFKSSFIPGPPARCWSCTLMGWRPSGRLDRYAGLAASHPGLIAGVLYRDFRRSRDDVTVVVVREGGDSR